MIQKGLPVNGKRVNILKGLPVTVKVNILSYCNAATQISAIDEFQHLDNADAEIKLEQMLTEARVDYARDVARDQELSKLFPGLFPANSEGTIPRREIIELLRNQEPQALNRAMWTIFFENRDLPLEVRGHIGQCLVDAGIDDCGVRFFRLYY